MKVNLAIIFIILANVMVSAQSKKGDEKVEDTSERKSVNGFAGHLVIAEDPKGFIEEWSKPQTPKIKVVTDVKRGKLIGAFVLLLAANPITPEFAIQKWITWSLSQTALCTRSAKDNLCGRSNRRLLKTYS